MSKETISIISVFINLVLSIFKILLGVLNKSSALVADGFHSVVDIISSAITFWGIKVSKRKPSKTHPYGWQRAEVLAGFIVTLFLIFAGAGIIWEALKAVIKGEVRTEIGLPALLVMVVSVAVNGVMARIKINIGQKEESLALVADGKHSRVDVLSSFGVLLGLWLARFQPVMDKVTALLVGSYILWEAIILGKEVTENLLDIADEETERKIRKICREEQVNLSSLKTRKIGALTFAELEIVLPKEVKISRADDLVSELQKSLINRIPRLEYVVIQIKGKGKRLRMLRGQCTQVLEQIGPSKKGYRTIQPYKNGRPYEDFGAPEYLVVDTRKGQEILKEIVVNPYYKIGRGHGVRFARAVQADEVKTVNIGENAQKALSDLKIKVTQIKK